MTRYRACLRHRCFDVAVIGDVYCRSHAAEREEVARKIAALGRRWRRQT